MTPEPHTDPLVDVATVAAAVAADSARSGPPPALLDVRWRLGSPDHGRAEYDAGHIPGAVFLDLDTALCGPPGPAGRHPLPEPAALQASLRAAGVCDDRPVVVYDAGLPEAATQSAARAWWTLRWAGLPDVRVLDGGFAAWQSAGNPVHTEPAQPPPGDVTVRSGHMPVLDAGGAAVLAANGVLVDARASARFRGDEEPVDPVAGHIPGAVNQPVATHLTDDGNWRAPEDCHARFVELGVADDHPVGAYCGSGVTAAGTVLALHRAGRRDAALYVGSWSQWVTDPERPVATGLGQTTQTSQTPEVP